LCQQHYLLCRWPKCPATVESAMPAKKPAAEPHHPASLSARCIKQLLERHAVPEYRQTSLLARVLGVGYQQARRKASGEAAWSLEDIAKVAEHFAEPLADVVSLDQGDEPHEAVLLCGALRVPCRIWLGKILDPAFPAQLVAVGIPGNWQVISSLETRAYPTLAVRRLVIQAPPVVIDTREEAE
jgi:hypothetical protein